MLPICRLYAVTGVFRLNLTQLGDLFRARVAGAAQIPQLRATINQRAGFFVEGKAYLNTGCLTVRTQQRIAENRTGHDLLLRRSKIGFRCQQGQVIFRDTGKRGITKNWHGQNTVHRFHPINGQKIFTEAFEHLQFGRVK